jgi:ATP/maltotriose-dependent transcriptional regulator MalT
MIWRVGLYGIGLGAVAWLLNWLEFRHAMRLHSTEVHAVAIALIFAAIGIWAGHRLTPVSVRPDFVRNDEAIASLGLSQRELDVLVLVAEGQSNKLIARALAISPNTVKTHVARLHEKLNAVSRTQAVSRARELEILP